MYELNKQIQKAATGIATSLGQEAAQVTALRDFNDEARGRDPSKLGWPTTLPIELALKTHSPQELKAHYQLDDEEWQALRSHPVFMAELAAAVELVKQDGMSFKLKARLQSEALLETSWRLIHAPHSEVPAAVKSRLMEATWRMAGFDSKGDNVPGGAAGLAIQINFNGAQPSVEKLNDLSA